MDDFLIHTTLHFQVCENCMVEADLSCDKADLLPAQMTGKQIHVAHICSRLVGGDGIFGVIYLPPDYLTSLKFCRAQGPVQRPEGRAPATALCKSAVNTLLWGDSGGCPGPIGCHGSRFSTAVALGTDQGLGLGCKSSFSPALYMFNSFKYHLTYLAIRRKLLMFNI